MAQLLVFLLLSVPLAAQLQDLSTTADGHQTYFSTAYRQKGSAQPGYLKIFRYAEDNRFQGFRELKYEIFGVDPNFYLAERPSVSGDGQVVAYTASTTCIGGSHCIGHAFHQGWVAARDLADRKIGLGMLTLSPDGKYVLAFDQGGLFQSGPVVTDLAKNTSLEAKGLSLHGDGRQGVANGGIALLFGDSPVLWNQGASQPLSFPAAAFNVRLSATARTVVYEIETPENGAELHSYDVSSGRDTLLATVPGRRQTTVLSVFHPTLTEDGALLAYILNGQLQVQATDGTGLRQFPTVPEGVTEATLSGFGNTAYAATSTGRLLRIDVPSGAVTELSPAVPHVDFVDGAVAQGARVDLSVSAAPANASDPVVIAGGLPAPIIARSGSAYAVQIPWEAAPGSLATITVPGNPSAFEEAHEMTVQPISPQFFTVPGFPLYALAAHQDFGAVVTDDKPAKPGEIVHLYLTGLGPVSPAIATGVPAPVGTLYSVLNAFSCQIEYAERTVPATVLFAGLAPLFTAVYQVDLQIPLDVTLGRPFLFCAVAWPTGPVSAVAEIPVAP